MTFRLCTFSYNTIYFQFLQNIYIHIGETGNDANKTAGEKARRQLHKNAASNIE